MAGHSRSKNGVALLAYVPAISMMKAECPHKRGHRDKPGDDKGRTNARRMAGVLFWGFTGAPVCVTRRPDE